MLHMLRRLTKRKAAKGATTTAGGGGGVDGGGGGRSGGGRTRSGSGREGEGIEMQSGGGGGFGSTPSGGGGGGGVGRAMSPPSLRKLVSEDGGHMGHALSHTPTEQSAAVEHSRPAMFLANMHSRESISEQGEDEVRTTEQRVGRRDIYFDLLKLPFLSITFNHFQSRYLIIIWSTSVYTDYESMD